MTPLRISPRGLERGVLQAVVILTTMAAVLAFYGWTVNSAQCPLEVKGRRNDY